MEAKLNFDDFYNKLTDDESKFVICVEIGI